MTSSLGQSINPNAVNQPVVPERISLLGPFVALFILGAVTVAPLPGWNIAVKVLGWVLALAALAFSFREGLRFTPELLMYSAFATWALAGLIGAFSAVLFWEEWFTILQMGGLILIVSTVVRNRKALSLCLGAVVVAGVVLGAHAFLTGEFARAQAETTSGGPAAARVAGLATNANAFAWLMILVNVALAYFWMMPSRRTFVRKGILICGMLGTGMGTVLSGSRMGIIGLGVFYLAWFWFCYRKLFLRHIGVTIAVTLFAVIGAYVFVSYVSSSGAAARLAGIADYLRGQHRVEGVGIRIQLLQKALEMLLEHPLTGVGMANFRFQGLTSFYSAHSEYGTIAAQTGFPGLFLYFGLMVVLWRRASKLVRCSDPVVNRVSGLAKAFLVTLFITCWANMIMVDKPTWILLACFAGYTHVVWKQIREAPVPAPEVGAGSAALAPT